jgi:hypothetical protein
VDDDDVVGEFMEGVFEHRVIEGAVAETDVAG